MVSPRPFRALRFLASRIDLRRALGSQQDDPRHAARLLDARVAPGDGAHGAARRARFRVADWRRAGIVARDRDPALTLIKRSDATGEALGLFCALPASAFAGTDPPHDTALEEWLDQTLLAVEPVVASFTCDARARRALDNAADREADAAWTDRDATFELWVIDDEATAARLAAMIGGSALELRVGAELLATHAAFAARRGQAHDDDAPPAASFALCFLHPADTAWPSVPRGAAMLPLAGTL
ncbi:MAG: hypothetical protein IT383_17215 [Deltaproteobacteria bacterium]|nr:hypothetical protein [Deltaproteobacteria bacterium]